VSFADVGREHKHTRAVLRPCRRHAAMIASDS
jgi:hypothetical protein